MTIDAWPFQTIWLVDYEFVAEVGERPGPVVCLVALELRSGRLIRQWFDEFTGRPPYDTGPDSLFVAYSAAAELSCHLALGWPQPARVLDLYVEFRNRTNGLVPLSGTSLIGALSYFGIDAMDAIEKEEMRQLVLRGGPWSEGEQSAILDYCQSDVEALRRLLPRMAPHIDLPRAMLRGRYMSAVASMEWAGVPIDVDRRALLLRHWGAIQDDLIAGIDTDYGVFEGRTFKVNRWADWLARQGIPWPRLDSGALCLDQDTFRQMARIYPAVSPMRELRSSLSEMRLNDLTVGRDGRNRVWLAPFASVTSRKSAIKH